MSGVTPGEVIKADDPRNPLGKMKIPLGDSYLIHQAKGTGDLGNLVSHGCVRMLRPELYDLAEKIIAARSAPVSAKRIAAAKRGSRMLVVRLDDPVPVDINYDTLVVEAGVLHVYPDVYGRGTNRPAKRRAKLLLPHKLPVPRFIAIWTKTEALGVLDQPLVNARLHLQVAI